MKKLLLTLFLVTFFLFQTPTQASAVYLPPTLYLGQAVPLHFDWQNKVRAYFILLNNVKSVSYTLTYKTNDIPQGVTGSFVVTSKKTVVKDIFLGTCSANSCMPHEDVEDLMMTVTFTYKDNHTETETYHLQ